MSASGPCVNTSPRTTKAIGALMSKRSSRAERRLHRSALAATTAMTPVSSPCSIAVEAPSALVRYCRATVTCST